MEPHCELCDRMCFTLIKIYKQLHGEYRQLYVCRECYDKHQRELELTRQSFYWQFGEN
jgi:hypothetical protein